MKAKANYTKMKFGLLTVLQCVEPSNGKNKGGQWLCKCKCRNIITLKGYQLHHRDSCGCLGRKAAVERGKSNRKSEYEKALSARYQKYKRGNPEPISKDKWLEIVNNNCSLCGDSGLWMNQIEVIENQPLCRRCNSLKNHMTIEEMKKAIWSIYTHLSQNQPDNNSTK